MRKRAFTLVELMIAVSLFGLLVTGAFGVYIMCQRMWRATSLKMETMRMASLAVDRMVFGLGTGSGLRAAAWIEVDTNKYKSLFSPYDPYWLNPTGVPPPADSAYNNLGVFFTNYTDGSWRIAYSNAQDGLRHVDYIRPQRTIVLWTRPGQSASRRLISNYVLAADLSNNAAGIAVTLTIFKRHGAFAASNRVSTFVAKRNQ